MDASRILVSSGAFLAVIAVCRWSEAANICNETVPANRMVDGIPAYAQCTGSTSSAIYSNNGVDTATTSGGTGWVRTQMSSGYQCTELAHRYLYFKWNVQSVPSGNAGVWCNGTIPSGLVKATTPMHGDLIVFAPGSCGADATTGHVAVVDVVNADSTVTFVEQNGASRRKCQVSTAACFLHVVANNGSSVDGGAASDAAIDTLPPGSDGPSVLSDVLRRIDGVGFADRPTIGTGGSDGAVASGGTIGAGGAVGSGGAVAGSGGASGVAGSTGTGGKPGTGGALGSGGALMADAAVATSATGTSGATGTGGTTTESSAAPIDSSSGCSCRSGAAGTGTQDGTRWLAIALCAALVAGRHARRRRGPGKR